MFTLFSCAQFTCDGYTLMGLVLYISVSIYIDIDIDLYRSILICIYLYRGGWMFTPCVFFYRETKHNTHTHTQKHALTPFCCVHSSLATDIP